MRWFCYCLCRHTFFAEWIQWRLSRVFTASIVMLQWLESQHMTCTWKERSTRRNCRLLVRLQSARWLLSHLVAPVQTPQVCQGIISLAHGKWGLMHLRKVLVPDKPLQTSQANHSWHFTHMKKVVVVISQELNDLFLSQLKSCILIIIS